MRRSGLARRTCADLFCPLLVRAAQVGRPGPSRDIPERWAKVLLLGLEHEVADQADDVLGVLKREHVAGVVEAHEPRLRRQRRREIFRVLDRHDRVEGASQLENWALDLRYPRRQIERQYSPRKKCSETAGLRVTRASNSGGCGRCV